MSVNASAERRRHTRHAIKLRGCLTMNSSSPLFHIQRLQSSAARANSDSRGQSLTFAFALASAYLRTAFLVGFAAFFRGEEPPSSDAALFSSPPELSDAADSESAAGRGDVFRFFGMTPALAAGFLAGLGFAACLPADVCSDVVASTAVTDDAFAGDWTGDSASELRNPISITSATAHRFWSHNMKRSPAGTGWVVSCSMASKQCLRDEHAHVHSLSSSGTIGEVSKAFFCRSQSI